MSRCVQSANHTAEPNSRWAWTPARPDARASSVCWKRAACATCRTAWLPQRLVEGPHHRSGRRRRIHSRRRGRRRARRRYSRGFRDARHRRHGSAWRAKPRPVRIRPLRTKWMPRIWRYAVSLASEVLPRARPHAAARAAPGFHPGRPCRLPQAGAEPVYAPGSARPHRNGAMPASTTRLVSAAHMAHLAVEETVFEPMAAAYACLRPEARARGAALVDFGHTTPPTW